MRTILLSTFLSALVLTSCGSEEPLPSATSSNDQGQADEDVCGELKGKLVRGRKNGFSEEYLWPVISALRKNDCP